MVWKRLKKLRERKGLLQKELAKRLGVPATTLNSWETGKAEPRTDRLIKLADFFEVSVDYLLGHVPLGEDPRD